MKRLGPISKRCASRAAEALLDAELPAEAAPGTWTEITAEDRNDAEEGFVFSALNRSAGYRVVLRFDRSE